MTSSRSLTSRRRQVRILSNLAVFFAVSTIKSAEAPAQSKTQAGMQRSNNGDVLECGAAAPFWRVRHYHFRIGRRIKSPSQSGCATPSRYACSDSTEELTRRLL